MKSRLGNTASLWVQGGLGNQLFQLSAGLHVTHMRSEPLLLSQSSFGRDKLRDFELSRVVPSTNVLSQAEDRRLGQPYNWRGKKRRSSFFGRVSYRFATDRPTENDFRPGTLNIGFYQEAAWLDLPTDLARARLAPLAERVSGRLPDGQLVAHVRRGDYATSPSARASFGYLDLDYYHRAAAHLGRELRDAIVFTDDVEAVQKEFGVPRERVIGPEDIRSPLDTLLTMSTASQLIIPNSTFSWWAAELAGDIPVVAPKTWFFDRPSDLKRARWNTVSNS